MSWSRRWAWAPLLLVGVYGVVLVGRLRDLMGHNALNADAVSAPVIGDLLPSAPGGREVLLGNFPWYQQLWFEQFTGWAPLHRQLWELFPFGLALVAAGLCAWAAAQVAGRWAALMTGALLFCASPPLITEYFQGTTHQPTDAQIALLAATAVWLASRPTPGRAATLGVTVVVGSLTAVGIASDPLFAAAGFAPFALIAALLWLRGERPAALTAVAVLAVGLVGGEALSALMHGANYRIHDLGLHFSQLESVFPNALLAFKSMAFMGNGDYWGRDLGPRGAFALLCAALVFLALLACGRSASGLARALPLADPTQTIYVAFWAAVMVGAVAVYVFSSAPAGLGTYRYLLPAWLALASLLPLAAPDAPARRTAIAAGVSVIAVASTIALARGDATDNLGNWPDGSLQGQLVRVLQPLHVKVGYAGYWDAAPITWGTKGKLQVFPVFACRGATLCRFSLHNISSWYAPRPDTKSFLIIDPAQPFVTQADPALGKPERTLTVGRLQVFIYGYDIASRMVR